MLSEIGIYVLINCLQHFSTLLAKILKLLVLCLSIIKVFEGFMCWPHTRWYPSLLKTTGQGSSGGCTEEGQGLTFLGCFCSPFRSNALLLMNLWNNKCVPRFVSSQLHAIANHISHWKCAVQSQSAFTSPEVHSFRERLTKKEGGKLRNVTFALCLQVKEYFLKPKSKQTFHYFWLTHKACFSFFHEPFPT